MQKIKFGVSISLNGRYSIQGKESFEGLCLWVKHVNQLGGIFVKEYGKKLPVELIHYDDESSIDRCQKLVEKLIVEDKVDILIGPYSSGHTLAAAPIAEKYKKILWNHGGSSDEIFQRGFTYIVSAITPASGYLIGIIDMAREIDKGVNRLSIFRAEDSGFSANVSEEAKGYGEERGFQVIEFKYLSGTKDFSPFFKQAKESNADIILGVGRAEDDLILARQIIENKVNAKAIGLVVAGIKEFRETLGKDTEGFLGPSQWERGIRIKPDFGLSPQEFFERFKSTYDKEPDYTAAQSYNIGLVIERCIEESGTLDDLSLLEAARRIEFKTFYGDFRIHPVTGNQIAHKTVVVQWQGGNKYIVYPEEVAERDPIYPKPQRQEYRIQ
jgi:branched-chain amino acid transport system substrate-binding protein